ncbi:MAG: hypothetical protein MPJ50_14485 [Pirellulales bacterium]|nr:hypothetical protein [Pirellulales bacterium]
MIRDRFYMLMGGCLSLMSAVVLLCTTHRLADTYAVGATPSLVEGLATTLAVTVWATCGVGLGLCMTSYGISIAAIYRSLTTPAKRALVLAGVVFTLTGVLLLVTFHDLRTNLVQLREANNVLAENIVGVANAASQRILSTFCAFVSAEMLTTIAISSLFLGEARETPRRPLRASLLAGLLAGVVGFTFAMLLATKFGAGAVTLTGTESAESLASLDSSLQWEAWLMIFSAGSLTVFGALRTIQAILFPVKDHA